jgi:folate-binding protein YgfZ
MWSLDWHWLACTGSEQRDYLERMLTCSVASLAPGETAHGLLLSRTGRTLGELWLLADEDHTLAGIASGGEPVIAELEKFVLAADVAIERLGWATVAEQAAVTDGWTPDGDTVRFRALLGQSVTAGPGLSADGEPQLAQLARLAAGIPDWDAEGVARRNPLVAGLGALVPAGAGCYPGQEVVSKLRNMGGLQRRLTRLQLSVPVEAGTSLERDGKLAGEVTSSALQPDGSELALGFVKRPREGERLAAGAADALVLGPGLLDDLPF